eukprot:scaffold24380_cov18-Tisochrysis_lutea.AAC.4
MQNSAASCLQGGIQVRSSTQGRSMQLLLANLKHGCERGGERLRRLERVLTGLAPDVAEAHAQRVGAVLALPGGARICCVCQVCAA